ncbi:MAG TPA: DNA-formamidopyrimidine glycosylase family protein [bacterium]|nr:DNA-formamidopyrimidine glycosylase family protein [bacterium]
MPELPFVTVVAENLAALITGRTVEDVIVRGVSVLKTFDPPITALQGRAVAGVRRRGKLLLVDVTGGFVIVIHLRRNGRLRAAARGTGRSGRDLALVLALDRGPDIQMIEMGPKKAASVWLFPADGLEAAEPLTGLGIEPLSAGWTRDALAQALRTARMRLKAFLVTQRYVVGIGNTYADEILWEARLSPQAMTTALDDEEIGRLYRAVVATLERGIAAHRTAAAGALPMKEPLDQLAVHRKGGEPCPRCGTRMAVIYYEDRETYYCPTCQAEGKVYADRRRSRLLR